MLFAMSIFLSGRNKGYSCFNWGIHVEMTRRLLNEVSWCVYVVYRVHSALGCSLCVSVCLSVCLSLSVSLSLSVYLSLSVFVCLSLYYY